MEDHAELFHLEACTRLLNTMEKVNGFRCKCLPDVVVAARRQIDVLAVPGLLLVKSFLEEKLNRMTKVLHPPQAILLEGYHRVFHCQCGFQLSFCEASAFVLHFVGFFLKIFLVPGFV